MHERIRTLLEDSLDHELDKLHIAGEGRLMDLKAVIDDPNDGRELADELAGIAQDLADTASELADVASKLADECDEIDEDEDGDPA